MKIGILSDIHLHRSEHRDQVNELIEYVNRAPDLDLLVCAGDLSHVTSELKSFLSVLRPACPRCWVPGNHDIWVIDPEHDNDTSEYRYRHGFGELSRQTGWAYLPEGALELPEHGVAVVGTMVWFSDKGFSEWFDTESADRDRALAERFASDLEAQIETLPERWKLVVVTHHVPDLRCLDSPAPGRGECNEHLAPVLGRYRDRIVAAIHGHRHHRYGPRFIDGVPFYAHPFGYPGQHEKVDDGMRIVEVTVG